MMTSSFTLLFLLCSIHYQFDDVIGLTTTTGIRFGVHEPVKSFYGRSDFLVRLRDSFQQQQDDEDNNMNQDTIQPIKIVIVEGSDGVGKTETVRKYVSTLSFSNSHDNVIWVDGESEQSVTNSFLSLANKILHPKTAAVKKEKSMKEIVQEIYRRLGQDNSLLIFDNVIRYKILQDFLPSSLPAQVKSPSILILTSGTTNETNHWPGGLSGAGKLRVLYLPEFSEEESASYLLKQLQPEENPPMENWREAKKLGRYLRNLPLALELAIADMKEENLDSSIIIKNYLHLLQQYTETYLNITKSRGTSAVLPHPLYFLWRVSMEKIGKNLLGDVALQIMDYLAFLHPESTPVKLIYDIFAYESSDISSQNVTQGLQLLQKYGMLRLPENFEESRTQPFLVHRKIQNFLIVDWNRRPGRISQCLNFLLGRLDNFLNSSPSPEQEEEGDETMYLKEMEHIIQKIGLIPPELDLIEYKLKYVMKIFQQQDGTQKNYYWILRTRASKMMAEAFQSLKQLDPNDRAHFIKIASILELPGPSSGKKETFYEKTLKLVIDIFGLDHPLGFKIMEKIAQTISELEGRKKDAIKVYKDLLSLQKLYWGPRDADVVRTLQQIASVHLDLGENDEARRLFTEASEIESTKFGEEAPETLESLHNVASVLASEKKFEESLNLYQKILDLEKTNLKPNHPSLFLTLHNMATVHHEAGDLEAALTLFKKAYEGNSRVLGAENPHTILSLREIGAVYYQQEKFKEAAKIYQQVYDLRRKKLDENDPLVLSSGQDLAETLFLTGDYEEGMLLLGQVLEKRIKILGPDHLDTLVSLETMENFRMTHNPNEEKGDSGPSYDAEEGSKIYRKIYKIRQNKLGEEHEATLKALNGLAYSLMYQNREEEAMEILNKIYSTQKQTLGLDHKVTLQSFNSIVRLHSLQGRHEKALQLLDAIYKYQLEHLDGGKNSHQILATIDTMAQVRRRQGQYSQALKIYSEALEKSRELLGPHDPLSVSTMQSMAGVYYEQQDAENFIQIQKEIYDIQSITMGPDHAKSLATLKEMIEVYLIEEKFASALQLYEKIYNLQESKLGPEHLDTVSTMSDMAGLIQTTKGREKEALPMYEKIYKIRKQKLGPNHPDSLQSLEDIGNFYYSQKKFDKALEIMEKVVEVKSTIFGKDDDLTISSILQMAGVMRMLNRIEQVMKLYEDLYELLKNKFGTQHERTMRVFDKMLILLDTMARDYSTKSAYGKSLEMLKKSLDLRSTVLGPDHPHTLTNLEDMALAQYDLGMYQSALKTLGQVLASKKKSLGPDHASVKETLHFMDAINMEMSQTDDDGDDDSQNSYERDEL